LYLIFLNVLKNNIALINQNFSIRESIRKNKGKWFNLKYGKLNLLNALFLPWNNSVGLYQQHLPTSLLKTTYEEVWESEPEVLKMTCMNRIRDFKLDVNQWLFKEWQVMKGNFEPRSIHFGKYIMVSESEDLSKVRNLFSQNKVKVFCLNDHITESTENVMQEAISIFEDAFPKKSSFEL